MEQVKESDITKTVNARRKVRRARLVIVNRRKLLLSCLLLAFMVIGVIYGIKEWKKTTNAIQQDARQQTMGTKLEKSSFPSEVYGVPVHTAIVDVKSKRKARN